jgi:hypothetical protein
MLTCSSPRLVQPTVAVARVSALLVNALWDHDDPVCVQKMREILAPPEKPEENMPCTASPLILTLTLNLTLTLTLRSPRRPCRV